MVSDHYKLGMQIATLLRIHSQTHRLQDLIHAIKINRLEMLSIGYDDNFLAFKKVMGTGKSEVWNEVILKLDRERIFINNAKWKYLCFIARKCKLEIEYQRKKSISKQNNL